MKKRMFLNRKRSFIIAGHPKYNDWLTKLVAGKHFIWLVLLFIHVTSKAQQSSIPFTHLNNLDGLSQSMVTAIAKDRYGFVWFGTQDGLNRYDGYSFKIYRHHPGDSTSLRRSSILSIYEDRRGDLWIGTNNGGLSKYDRTHDRFIHYKEGLNVDQLSQKSVTSIFEDRQGNFWIGTYWNLNLLDRKTGKVKRYAANDANPADVTALSHNGITAIYEDSKDNLWIGTSNGLNLFDKRAQKFKHYFFDSKDSTSLGNNHILVIKEDSKKRLWIGTNGGGLNLFDASTGSFKRFQRSSSNNASLNDNTVNAIGENKEGLLWIGTLNGLELFNPASGKFQHYLYDAFNDQGLSRSSAVSSILCDKDNILWVGTYQGGINKHDPNLVHFPVIRNNPSDYESLGFNTVSSFAESPDGNIWVGTNGGGLSYWNRNTGKFIRYNPEAGKSSLSSWGVLSLCQSKSGYLWIGSYGGGVDRYDATNKTFKNYKKGTGPGDLNNDQVYALFEDSKGNLWIGTNGGGVNVMNGSTGFITRYVHGADRPNSLAGNYIRAFYEDKAGKIWIGTSTGLSVYNPATAKFSVYDQSNSDLESDLIFSIKGDLQNNIWIGTVGGGLSMWNEKANKFFTYTTNDGLADNTINSIIADDKGYLWLSTNNGICQFDVVRKKSKNYDPLNGIQSFEYNQNAGLITSKGEILFGGINGFNAFYPETFKDNKNVAPVLITGLSLFNKPVRAGAKNSPLKTSILETEEIQLSYDQSIITISYGAVNMTATRRNNYAYKLEGFDKDWNYVNGNRTATYTNLSPGEYLFRVKGSNNDGIWNEQETTLKILVKPPYWKTTWFRLLAILIIAASIFFYYKRRMSSILEREHELAAQVLERTEKLEQLSIQERNTRRQAEQSRYEAERARHEAERANSAKSSFLATMSHEIRTPMNGVIGTTSLLKETELTGEQQKYVEVIQSSGQNLLAVINDILDFSKIESGKIDLENHSFSLKECIVEVMNLFIAITVKNNIKLHYKIDGDVPPQVLGDSVRLKQILINLVGNATKFTQQGEIFLGVSVTEQKENGVKLKFAVQDTGIGIPLDKQERLFKAFTQVDSTTTRKYGGSGLGLAISKKLVEVMGGSIDICSEENKGTCFTFSIVTGIDALYKKKTADNMSTDAAKKLSTGFALKYPLNILVAEDNPVNQMIAMNVLKKLGYSADLAINGAKAVEAFEVKDYDLILMDIQMPEMDGFEATKTIRNTFKSKPVIIAVTANAMQEDKDACLAAGMDDYISKPIALDKLLLLLEKWGNVIKTKVPVI